MLGKLVQEKFNYQSPKVHWALKTKASHKPCSTDLRMFPKESRELRFPKHAKEPLLKSFNYQEPESPKGRNYLSVQQPHWKVNCMYSLFTLKFGTLRKICSSLMWPYVYQSSASITGVPEHKNTQTWVAWKAIMWISFQFHQKIMGNV